MLPGIYRADDVIVRVRLNRDRTRVYSQVWTQQHARVWKWEYAPEAITTLRPEHRLPLAEAREISRAAGQCLACARPLSDPRSLALGIGPACERTFADAGDAARRLAHRAAALPNTSAASLAEQHPLERAARQRRARASVRARRVGETVRISSGFDDRIIDIVRSIPGRAWDGSGWTIPLAAVGELAEAFELASIAHDDLAIIAVGWDRPDDLPIADHRLIIGSPPYMPPAPLGGTV